MIEICDSECIRVFCFGHDSPYNLHPFSLDIVFHIISQQVQRLSKILFYLPSFSINIRWKHKAYSFIFFSLLRLISTAMFNSSRFGSEAGLKKGWSLLKGMVGSGLFLLRDLMIILLMSILAF
ncbi:hypothetical protein QL285_020589 [Trifolium repens]|nr:hypothetical protein QL285_020589 [Trifolium repens]